MKYFYRHQLVNVGGHGIYVMVGELRSGMRCNVMSNMRRNMMCNMKAAKRDEQYEAGDMTCEQGVR